MEEIIEIIVSIIGLIFYWLLTSRKSASKKKKVKPVQPPRSARQREREKEPEAEPEEVYEPVESYEEEEEEEEVGKALTFDELLEQFTGNKSKKPVFEPPNEPEVTQSRKLPQRQREDYLDEYKPIVKGGERLMKPGEHTGSILKKSIEELPTPKVTTPALRFDNYKKKRKSAGNKYARKFKDLNSVRDALIMKEIFDRKYF